MTDQTMNGIEENAISDVVGPLSKEVSSSGENLSLQTLPTTSSESHYLTGLNVENGMPPSTQSLDAPRVDTSKVTGRENAFAQLVRGWESYMSNNEVDPFQPLQMLQGLALCGPTSHGVALLTQGSQLPDEIGVYHPLAPPALRHTHSSPNHYRSSMTQFDQLHQNAVIGEDIPPPAALDLFQRSCSTPSAFRKHSAQLSSFGTASSSAFTLPSQRVSYTGKTYNYPGTRYSAFDPVMYYATALEDMERTSIEVTDITPRSESETNVKCETNDLKLSGTEQVATPPKRGAAFRAARFLSDVRVLRRKRRFRNGRENPAEPQVPAHTKSKPTEDSIEDNSKATPRKLETAVTVVTETHFENPNNSSMLSRSSELSAIVGNLGEMKGIIQNDFDSCSNDIHMSDQEDCKDDDQPAVYQQLDSDIDEEDNLYRRIDSQLHVDSPGTVASPSYQNFLDDQPLSSPNRASTMSLNHESPATRSAMRSQSSNVVRPRLQVTLGSSEAASPSPTRMDCSDGASLTPRSNASPSISPGTTRSSGTGSSSGHTTQATSIASSLGQQSGLSTISETDREVMEANKEAKRRRGLDNLLPSMQKPENDVTSLHSSSTDSTNPHGYLALGGSPTSLRDGANVPVDRFFSHSSSSSGPLGNPVGYVRAPTESTSSRRSGATTSPSTNSESVSATNTSSSNSYKEEPPKFVSYLDRELQSDLTTFREAMETSSERGDEGDEREPSPAPFNMVDTDDLYEEPKAAREQRIRRLEKFRSLPPRSPAKGIRPPKTPPPRGSVSPLHHLSPPRKIVDHPDSNISRPYVRRSAISSYPSQHLSSYPFNTFNATSEYTGQEASLTEPSKPNLISTPSMFKDCTCEESSIEIMKSDSTEEMIINVITPDKEK